MKREKYCPWLTHNTESAWYWDGPLRVELADVFTGIWLLDTADVEKPGVSDNKRRRHKNGKWEYWVCHLLSNVEENLSFWATISGNTAIIPFSEWSHATYKLNFIGIIYSLMIALWSMESSRWFWVENSSLQQFYGHLSVSWIIIKL